MMKKALVLLAVFVALISGCVSDTPVVAPLTDEAGTNAYADAEQVRSRLQIAIASGGMSPEAYIEIGDKINSLENSGYDTGELRQLLSQTPVGGQENAATYNEPETLPQTSEENINSLAPQVVTWHYRNGKWAPDGEPPACPDKLVLQAPVDLRLPTSVLYPGQVRGGDFKPHGGFRTDDTDGPVEVTAPLQGYLKSAAYFTDSAGDHYMFDIQHQCGIMYRLGHLGAVPPKFQAVVDKIPKGGFGDSRTYEVGPVFVELGEVIATDTQWSTGFDWGVYDLRKENEASQDPAFREAHKDEPWQAYHALCWFDYLPSDQEQIVRSLPAADGVSGKTSAYC
ncbi:MAG: hypothetical protein A3B70_00600 [Deltaproteobacteria bacterium RIFCSPHIGHO2_02_FULL_40_11]|nr:MAG: hypothetical protein A3B70_00600 [Deltaproteobacteria bacterium RIFCSPHIGHO2_02_FULL_40_11]